MVQQKYNYKSRGRSGRAGDPRVGLLRELADPLRLRVVDRLGHRGPATVSQLAGELEVPLPQLSNHLRRLREAGLVRVERRGRQAVYQLGDPGLETLLPLLDRITGHLWPPCPAFAGRLPDLLRPPGRAAGGRAVPRHGRPPGPGGAARRDGRAWRGGLPDIGRPRVDVAAVAPGRRRLAFQCLDATERAPHLAGALGDAVAAALLTGGWVERTPGSRTVQLTPAGARGLRRALGLTLEPGRV